MYLWRVLSASPLMTGSWRFCPEWTPRVGRTGPESVQWRRRRNVKEGAPGSHQVRNTPSKCNRGRILENVDADVLKFVSNIKTNLSMHFTLQVREKIKHGTTRGITVFAPVVSSVIVFKRLGGSSLSRGGSRRLVQGRSRRRPNRRRVLKKIKRKKN